MGTALIKTFYQGDRIVETRLLALASAGWQPYVYLWNQAETEATLTQGGARVSVETADGPIEYVVPNAAMCASCHARSGVLGSLGLTTEQLNLEILSGAGNVNQIDNLANLGGFATAPPDPATLPALAQPFETGPLEARARAYLHGNCAHCHREGGLGGPSGLVLSAFETTPGKFGVCKVPTAAGAGAGGRAYDVVPGKPEESILPYRMSSTDAAVKMPEIPNRLPHAEGVALIEAWIAAMTPAGCP